MLRLAWPSHVFHSPEGRDRGQIMLAVVGLMAVTVIITATLAVVTVRALSFTTMTRAGVEAQAAAESGVQAMILELNQGACVPGASVTRTYGDIDPLLATDPRGEQDFFTVTVQTRTSPTAAWEANTCPTEATTHVLITSTGYALDTGLSESASARDAAAVEAVYEWTVEQAAEPTDPIPATGSALYGYGSSGTTMTASGVTINPSPTGLRPTFQLRNGTFVCSGSSVINGNLSVRSGEVRVNNGCTIDGDVRSSGGFRDASGARVTGSVYTNAMLTGNQYRNYSVILSDASVIGGDVVADGPVEARGSIGGNLIAGPRTGNSLFYNSVRVGGNVTTAGGLLANGGLCSNCSTNQSVANRLKVLPHVQGTVRYNQSGIQAPGAPSVPGWVEFNYNRNDWVTASGTLFDEVVLSSSDCNWGTGTTGLQKLRTALASGRPTIVNALACGSNGIQAWDRIDPALSSDLVIVAQRFRLGATGQWTSTNAQPKRLWFITPDRTASTPGSPTCSNPADNSTINSGGMTIASGVSAMFYTPCDLTPGSGLVWRGQMYARNVNLNSGGLTMTYVPVGLPGVDLATGAPVTGGGSGGGAGGGEPAESAVGNLVSFRDIPVSSTSTPGS